jgi:hypothetical protein
MSNPSDAVFRLWWKAYADGQDEEQARKVFDASPVDQNLGAVLAAEAQRLFGGRWEKIESAPKSTSVETVHGHMVTGKYFLAYCPEEGVTPDSCICVCWWEPHSDGGRWQGEADFPLKPTHWMPLPAPPADE